MAWGLAQELGPRGATAVALTPGWLRSEMMLDAFGVTEANWRDAMKFQPHFCVSESPLYVGRAVAALAGDPDVARWNGKSVSVRRARAGLRVHGYRRHAPGRVALHRRAPRPRAAGGRHRLPLTLRSPAKRPGARLDFMLGDSDLAAVGALIGEPARARVLMALADGRELPASVLASEAGVAASTASVHLARLVDGGLVTVESRGRHRYFRLAGPKVGRAIEALAAIAPPAQVRSLKDGTRAQAVRAARTCYDHLAGPARRRPDGRAARARDPERRRRALRARAGSRGPPVGLRARRRLPALGPRRGRRCTRSASTSTRPSPAAARRSATASTGASRTTISAARSAPRSRSG